MKFLTASNTHGLLPLHHRLRREGHDCEALVWRSKYDKAWDGSVAKLLRQRDGSLNASNLKDAVSEAQKGGLGVLTDVHRVAELFHTAPLLHRTYKTPTTPVDAVRVGGWFTGEEVRAPHLLVADVGAWTGGLGPAVLGGLTLIRTSLSPELLKEATQAATTQMKQQGFKGLFHFDILEVPETGELKLNGMEVGWPWLHTQAFVAELASLGTVLQGEEPTLQCRYVTAMPVSIPPWPSERQGPGEEVPIEGLTPTQQGRMMWHDIKVRPSERKLTTAGLDGLVGVALGASNSTPALARARALELCQRLQVPELQYRQDAGARVDQALATLEDRWGFSV